MNYTIVASFNGSVSRVRFNASDDTEATYEAVGVILNKAMTSKVWAKGAIELRNSDGEVIHEMGAK
jgi:hypothetical protein